MNSFITEILQILITLAIAPVYVGWVRMLKCWLQGRTTAGLFQPYRDLMKLFAKDVVLAENASWVFRFTPYIVFGTLDIVSFVVIYTGLRILCPALGLV